MFAFFVLKLSQPPFTCSHWNYQGNKLYLFKVNNQNTGAICWWRRSGVVIINFEQISCIVFVFQLLSGNIFSKAHFLKTAGPM